MVFVAGVLWEGSLEPLQSQAGALDYLLEKPSREKAVRVERICQACRSEFMFQPQNWKTENRARH